MLKKFHGMAVSNKLKQKEVNMKKLITLILIISFLATLNNVFSGVIAPEGAVPDFIDPDYGYKHETNMPIRTTTFGVIRLYEVLGIEDEEPYIDLITKRLSFQGITLSSSAYRTIALKLKDDAALYNAETLDILERLEILYYDSFLTFLGGMIECQFYVGDIADLIMTISGC